MGIARMIDEVIRVHDEFSVEIKLGYETRRTKKINDYIVNTWIFFPNSLDINRSTYGKNNFYNDLKYNVRLNTPVFLLRDIAHGDNSPLNLLTEAFNVLASSPLRRNTANYEYHLKMFHSIVKSSLKNEIDLILNNFVPEDTLYLISEYIKNIEVILSRYRELRRIIIVPTVSKEILNYYILGDEFMSNTIEQYTFYLIDHINDKKNPTHVTITSGLLNLVRQEHEYKRKKGYPVIEKKTPDHHRENIFRRGVLKKYFESQLFLSIRKMKDGMITEQIIYSVAAGFAMIFATGVAFFVQGKFGNFTFPLFVALVISYMLKDRIKDLLRFYFAGKMKQKFFDHKNLIRVKENQIIGWCKESFDFVPEENVPKEVLKHCNRSQIMVVENRIGGEKIVLYRKFLRLNRHELNKVYEQYSITGINDIIRLNVSRYIRMMDNPKTPLYTLHDNGSKKIFGERVYYLNLILNCQYDDQSRFSRYRIIFNRTGIKEVVKL